MNASNALIFAALGSVMELLPRVFPSWFTHTGADEQSCRALWLSIMGAVQLTLGLGLVIRSHIFPAVSRIFVSAPAQEPGTLALPNPRAVTSR
jgi:hypothetical protein